MTKSTKLLVSLAAASGLVAGGFFWWWNRLIMGTFAQCVGGDPPAGVDCRHDLQMYAAATFAAVTLVLLLIVAVRLARPTDPRPA